MASDGKFYAGLDVSTQSCNLVILDYNRKKFIYGASVNYDRDLPKYNTLDGVCRGLGEGISESDPNMWLEAVNLVFAKMKKEGINAKHIRAISVSGQQHGLVCLDKEGNLTRRRSKLWNDYSTSNECEELTSFIGGKERMIKEVANTQRTGYTAGKILHFVKHEPKAYKKTTTLFLVHNYINWFLTGGVRVMEHGDTSGTGLWNPATKKWSKRLCNYIAPDLIRKLPPVLPSDKMIGYISPYLAQKYGFDRACKIDAGSGDNMYGAIGTGNVKEGIFTVSLGTSGTAYTFLKKPYVDHEGDIASFCDSTGNYLPLLCVSNLANGYNAILRQYSLTHRGFEKLVSKTPTGNDGLVLLPWYMGERTPDLPIASPVYFGFNLDDFTKEKLARVVLEGHILNLYEGCQRFPVKAKQIRLTGGLSSSKVWRQTIADIFNAEVLPIEGESAAIGAAIHAAWVDNKPLNIAYLADEFLNLTKPQKPIRKNVVIYNSLKKIYSALSKRVRGIATSDDPFHLRKSSHS